jgi:hypothetical protein
VKEAALACQHELSTAEQWMAFRCPERAPETPAMPLPPKRCCPVLPPPGESLPPASELPTPAPADADCRPLLPPGGARCRRMAGLAAAPKRGRGDAAAAGAPAAPLWPVHVGSLIADRCNSTKRRFIFTAEEARASMLASTSETWLGCHHSSCRLQCAFRLPLAVDKEPERTCTAARDWRSASAARFAMREASTSAARVPGSLAPCMCQHSRSSATKLASLQDNLHVCTLAILTKDFINTVSSRRPNLEHCIPQVYSR